MRSPTPAFLVLVVAQQVRMTVGRALSPCSEMSTVTRLWYATACPLARKLQVGVVSLTINVREGEHT